MGVDKAGKNLDVAMKENDVISYEDDYSTKYQGYVPGSPESFIIFSLIQSAYLSQSCTFADMVQKQFASQTKMQNRGVHQAGFLVLWSAAMPEHPGGVRVYFESRGGEVRRFGQRARDVCALLFNAFSEYKVRSEGRGTRIVLSDDDGDDSQPRNDSAADFARDEPGNGRNGERHGRQRRGDRLPGSSRFGPAETCRRIRPVSGLIAARCRRS